MGSATPSLNLRKITENFQLDTGTYFGLTDSSDDLTTFIGANYRL
jgi:hypothetical protein